MGLGYATDYVGGPRVWAVSAMCFLAMIGLIGYSVWLTKDAFPIAVLLPALGAFFMGNAGAEQEKKKRLAEQEKREDP